MNELNTGTEKRSSDIESLIKDAFMAGLNICDQTYEDKYLDIGEVRVSTTLEFFYKEYLEQRAVSR